MHLEENANAYRVLDGVRVSRCSKFSIYLVKMEKIFWYYFNGGCREKDMRRTNQWI